MSDIVQGPVSEMETRRFLKHGTRPKLDDLAKEHHRIQAHTAHLWSEYYHIKVLESDYPDEMEFWQKREAHYRLECQLHLSILDEDA